MKKRNCFNLTMLFLFFKNSSRSETSRHMFSRTRRRFRLFQDTFGSISLAKIVVALPDNRFTAATRATLARIHILADRFFFTARSSFGDYITNARFNEQSTGTEACCFRSTFFQSERSSMETIGAVCPPFLENIQDHHIRIPETSLPLLTPVSLTT